MVELKLAASADKAYALLTDPKWLEARCLALGELSASCKAKKTPSMVVTMKRKVRRELNAMISKVLNPESDIELLPEGKGCVYRIQHHAKVNVPLIGGVVAKFVLGQTEQGCADELAYLADFLKKNK